MAPPSYSKNWDLVLDHEDAGSYYIVATPKPTFSTEYGKAILKIQKGTFFQENIDFFNRTGEKVKVFSSSNVKDYNGIKRASIAVLGDPRTGHRTEMLVKSFKVNQGLKDDMFTVRQLQMGK
jgi:hypothetical protein